MADRTDTIPALTTIDEDNLATLPFERSTLPLATEDCIVPHAVHLDQLDLRILYRLLTSVIPGVTGSAVPAVVSEGLRLLAKWAKAGADHLAEVQK
jgi:hypothetical protein